MKRAFKYKLKPTMKQQKILCQFFGSARFIYNWGLNKKISTYKESKKSIGYIELAKQLTELKKQKETLWLNECANECLQQSLRNLDNAYTRFFKEKKGFPKFKTKKHSKDVCKFINSVKFDFNQWKVKIPKIGWTKLCLNRTFDLSKVKLGTLTVSRDNIGQYWCIIIVEDGESLPPKTNVREDTTIGIDLGIKEFAILSDGTKFPNPKYYEKTQRRLATLQRVHARKQKGSKRREKARLALAKCQKRIANQRMDMLHKLTTYLVKDYDTICLEDLNISGMLKNPKLAKSIQSVSWSEFRRLLEYKCDWKGKNLLLIGRFEPSSKMCHVCGYIKSDLTLKDRKWECPVCKRVHDRDVNAAINIRDFGLHPQNKRYEKIPPQVSGEEDVEGRGYKPYETSK